MSLLVRINLTRPIRNEAECSTCHGSPSAAPRGAKEIASVTRSFDRMRKSLEKALRLLEK